MLSVSETLAELGSNDQTGLSDATVKQRQQQYGPNEIVAEPPVSPIMIIGMQLRDAMNLMLIAVSVISLFIGQEPVGIMVGLLVILNVTLATRQEMKARASVNALAKLQIPLARVVRDGTLEQIPAVDLVPGDIVQVEAGDLIPADGRLVRSATLETMEAALTGESAPIAKDAAALTDADVQLGDRTNMVYQNTTVSRGTATLVVTGTGMNAEMGKIASMLSAVKPTPSPLQQELGQLTKVLGIIAWLAVAIIVVIGLIRGREFSAVLLLGITMAISAIPTGMPTFVQAILAHGAKQLADAKAVIKNLADVETLGATSAINSDKTGTLTLNAMTVRSLFYLGRRYQVQGEGYDKQGAILQAAGEPVPDFTMLALGLCLDSDATVSDSGDVVGDPTEAALVVLAAKVGIDAEETRRVYPRVAEVPFDSAYKFMATFHTITIAGEPRLVELVKGAPDVLLQRCTRAASSLWEPIPIEDARAGIDAYADEMSRQGSRVLAFAYRLISDSADAVIADPMSFVSDLVFTGMVGIIDPLRPEAIDAVAVAHRAGIDVRMITGDHAVTAAAIGKELGLGAGAMSGSELQALSDDELKRQLPDLHVFGRVTPQDKLRLARAMQEMGEIVAMTGDAVNDAAALKQADIGVAMGSGSEVTKQAGKMILTDDNFGTLVTAIRLGRSIYAKIVAYVRYQMSGLLALVLLFLVASIFDINDGVPLTPLMALFQNFFIVFLPVLVILSDPPAADLMEQPPRDPRQPLASPFAIRQWAMYGTVIFAVTLGALLLAPGEMSSDEPSVPVTMAFVVMSLASLLGGLAMRRDPLSGFAEPILNAAKIIGAGVLITVLAVETSLLQRALSTVSLTGNQWLACIAWALIVPAFIEAEKWYRRRSSDA